MVDRKPVAISPLSIRSCYLNLLFRGTRLATGSGFLCRHKGDTVLVTARHNVTGRDNYTDECLSSNGGIPDRMNVHFILKDGRTVEQEIMLYVNERSVWLEHPAIGSRMDVVAFKIPSIFSEICDSYSVEDFYFPDDGRFKLNSGNLPLVFRVADAASVIGYPFGVRVGNLFPVWATGFIASEPDVDFEDMPLLLIDCRARQGQSGSPVVISDNGNMVEINGSEYMRQLFGAPSSRLIGVYSGRINRESDIGRVWKISAVREIIDLV